MKSSQHLNLYICTEQYFPLVTVRLRDNSRVPSKFFDRVVLVLKYQINTTKLIYMCECRNREIQHFVFSRINGYSDARHTDLSIQDF